MVPNYHIKYTQESKNAGPITSVQLKTLHADHSLVGQSDGKYYAESVVLCIEQTPCYIERISHSFKVLR